MAMGNLVSQDMAPHSKHAGDPANRKNDLSKLARDDPVTAAAHGWIGRAEPSDGAGADAEPEVSGGAGADAGPEVSGSNNDASDVEDPVKTAEKHPIGTIIPHGHHSGQRWTETGGASARGPPAASPSSHGSSSRTPLHSPPPPYDYMGGAYP
jgi:hypothetical protein